MQPRRGWGTEGPGGGRGRGRAGGGAAGTVSRAEFRHPFQAFRPPLFRRGGHGSGLHGTWNPGGTRDFGHFQEDVNGRINSFFPGRTPRTSTEAVVDWSGTVTYFDNLGIVPTNRVSSQIIRGGRVVGYNERALTEFRQMLTQRYRQLRAAASRTQEEERLLRALENAIPERFR